MNPAAYDSIRPVQWEDNTLRLLDQRLLPDREEYISYSHCKDVADAIRDMVVRGAPAIGVAAAYGFVLAVREARASMPSLWRSTLEAELAQLTAARPTAINLQWAVDTMRRHLEWADTENPVPALIAAADRIAADDLAANITMGDLGAAELGQATSVLTHCNAGALATSGYGTALGVIRSGVASGRIEHVYADETRPWLQGARLTSWELQRDGIPATLLCEGAAASLMAQGKLGWVIVGADRVTANGDVANKIGTYSLAVLARHHGVRFMVVAPCSTIDLNLADGTSVPIEQRSPDEILTHDGHRVAPEGVAAWNPAFDITPASLVDVLVTERGVLHGPDTRSIAALFVNAG